MDPALIFTIDLQPSGRRVQVPPATTLLEAVQKAGIDLAASCGGAGFCGTCLVRVIQGRVTAITPIEQDILDEERIQQKVRLACQTVICSDARVFIPAESLAGAQQLQIEGLESDFNFQPAVIPLDLELSGPGVHDLRADLRRVNDASKTRRLPPLIIPPSSAAGLSVFLREHAWKCRLAVRPDDNHTEMVACLPFSEPILGLAMDIGSTKVALYLVDLESGGTLATSGLMNPQIAYGEDVVSRIAFSNRDPQNRHFGLAGRRYL